MPLELFYTSVPEGLKRGSSGFCTVACTGDMPAPMIQRLEALSAYRPIYRIGSGRENINPTEYAHWRVNVGGRYYSVLSRVCFADADYSGRSNKFAHHVALDSTELPSAGPAWVMMQPAVLQEQWTGQPRYLPAGKTIPSGTNALRVCEAWARMTGDAGWAGVLADAFLLDASKPAYILFEPGMDLLPLINEAIALVPERARWRVTFSTFFNQLPAGLYCTWRCCAVGTPAADAARANATSGVLIDLTSPTQRAPDNRYVLMARTGKLVAEETMPVSLTAQPEPLGPEDAASVGSSPAPLPQGSPPEPGLGEELGAGQQTVFTHAADALGRSHEVTPTRPRTLFWLIAITWPVVVLAFAILILQNRTAVPPISAVTLEQEDLVKKLETEYALSKELRTRLEQAEDENARLKADQQKLKETVRENEELWKQIAEIKSQQELQKALPKTPVTVMRTDSQPQSGSLTSGKPIAQPLPGHPNQRAADLPLTDRFGSWQASRTALLADLAADAGIRIRLPVSAPEADGVIVVDPFRFTRADGKVVIQCDVTKKYIQKEEKTIQLATVGIEQGALIWEWYKPDVNIIRHDYSALLKNLVRYSTLQIVGANGSDICQIQLTLPQALTLNLTMPKPHKRAWLNYEPQLLMVSTPSAWSIEQAESDQTRQTIKSNHGAKFEITVSKSHSDAGMTEICLAWLAVNPLLNTAGKDTQKAEREFDRMKDRWLQERQEFTIKKKELTETISKLENAIKNEEEIIDQEVEIIKQKKETLGQQILDQESALDQLYESNSPKLKSARDEYKVLESQLNQARKNQDDGEVQRITREIDEQKRKINRLWSRLKRKARGEIQEAEEDISQTRYALKSLRNDINRIRNSEKLARLKKQLKDAKDDNAKAQHKWQQLDEDYNEQLNRRNQANRAKQAMAAQVKEIEQLGELQVHVVAKHSGAVLGTIAIEK